MNRRDNRFLGFTGKSAPKWREAHVKELLAEMEQQARLLARPPEE
jgi:hypothetical protein